MTDTITVTVAQTVPSYLDDEPDVLDIRSEHYHRSEAAMAIEMLRSHPRQEIVYVSDPAYITL